MCTYAIKMTMNSSNLAGPTSSKPASWLFSNKFTPRILEERMDEIVRKKAEEDEPE